MHATELTAASLTDPAQREQAVAELRLFLRAGLGRSFGRQLDDALLDDVAQDAVVRVLARLDDFAGRSRLSTWAMSIAVREALQHLRRQRTEHLSLEDAMRAGHQLLTCPQAPDDLQQAALRRHLQAGIAEALSPVQRDALLAELGGLPLMEIARRQGRSRGALYKSLHDARRKLRRYLEAAGIDADALGVGRVSA